MTLVWVIVAGGVGSGARFLIGQWTATRLGPAFPYGTLIVNLAGCFVLGFVAHVASSSSWSPESRVAITAGLLGGFTTYSSFNQETLTLVANGSTGAALLNVVATLVGGLLAGAIGLVVARQLVA